MSRSSPRRVRYCDTYNTACAACDGGTGRPHVFTVRRHARRARPRVLIVEDDPARINQFLAATRGYGVLALAQTAEEGVRAFDYCPYDAVFLDYDLLPGHYAATLRGTDPGPGTGADVARAVAAMPPEQRPGVVYVHTLNPLGAERIVEALGPGVRWEEVPYGGQGWRLAVARLRGDGA